jgi:hypothetical protein
MSEKGNDCRDGTCECREYERAEQCGEKECREYDKANKWVEKVYREKSDLSMKEGAADVTRPRLGA